MRIVFSVGMGFIMTLFLKGLPRPFYWILDQEHTYRWKNKIYIHSAFDIDLDALRRRISRVKKLT